MKNRLKKFGQTILWLLLGIFIGGWLIYTITLLQTDQQLTNAYIALGTLILAGATVLLAVLTWLNIRSSNEREKRDRKERLLNEIIEWAEDIDIASLTPDISLIASNAQKAHLLKTERDVNTLRRYGISRSKATSILTITEERFKEELLDYVTHALNELVEFMYIKELNFTGASPNDENYPEEIIDKMTKEIAKGDKSFEQIFKDHAKSLAESIRELLKEANKTKANLQ